MVAWRSRYNETQVQLCPLADRVATGYTCHVCNEVNTRESKFCNQCGTFILQKVGVALDLIICGFRHPNLLDHETDWDCFRAELARDAEVTASVAKEKPFDDDKDQQNNKGKLWTRSAWDFGNKHPTNQSTNQPSSQPASQPTN